LSLVVRMGSNLTHSLRDRGGTLDGFIAVVVRY
jgi:hypothetical protein